MRRKVESVNTRWGNLVAIVAGDFLLASSAEIAASLGQEVAALLANTLARLCEGQLVEIRSSPQHRAQRRGLLRDDRGKDGRAHGHLVPRRRHHRRSIAPPRSRPSRASELLRDGLPDPRRHPRRDRNREGARQARRPGPRRRASTPCRCSSPSRDPGTGPELQPASRRPARPARTGEGPPIVAESGAIAETVAVGQRYVEEAIEAAQTMGEHALGALPRGPGQVAARRPARLSLGPRPVLAQRATAQRSGRRVGKAITSRMLATSARIITSRSMPIPSPPVGGKPCSRARR